MNYLIGFGFGLIAGVITWIVAKIVTIKLRKELKVAATIELEEVRSQEGYNAASFLRQERGSASSEEEMERRELMATASGGELRLIDRFILKTSIGVTIVTTVIIIAGRFLKEI